MTWFTGIIVFVITWWLFFFMMLPVGVKTQEEAGGEMVPGTVESAPKKPYLLRKALAATLLAAISLVLFEWLVNSQLVTFRPAGS